MDAKQLVALLQATYSAGNERKVAEQHLKQLETAPGYSVALLQIVAANELDLHLRQSAAINVKQTIQKMWYRDPEDDPVKYPRLGENDRKLIKENIVEVLIHAPSLIRSQIGVCLREVVETEYPAAWPELLPKILSFLSSKDPNIMQGSLDALREVVKRYEFVQPGKKRRQPLNEIVEQVFPILLQLFNHLLPMTDVAAAQMLKTILKCFWSAINYGLPPYLLNDANFVQWASAMLQLLEKPIPSEGQPTDPEERQKYPWWKAKKWCASIFQRLYSRYGDPKLTDGKSVDVLEFSKRFSANYAPKLLESFLSLLNVIRSNGYLPERITYHALSFLNTSIRHNKIYALVKPHMDVLYRDILFKLIAFNDHDQMLWQDDPHEYLRREMDSMDEFYSPRNEALNLLIDIARLRGKNHLKPFMDYVAQILVTYNNTEVSKRNTREKHGAMYIIGALADKLLKSKEFSGQIESIIEIHVLPEYTSPVPYLRERALWVFTQYYDIEWTKPQVFLNGLYGVINCMNDTELPVKIRSAINLRFIIRNPIATEHIKPIIPNLLDQYFKLMNELDNDDLIAALEELVDQFEDQMAPYATTLCAKLSEAFLRMIGNEEEDESAIAALEVLGAIQTILRSISDVPQIYPQVEAVLAPLLVKLLDPENSMEFFEEASKIASYITFYGPSISEFMWTLFPKFYSLFENYSMDVVQELLVPFDNYISRGTQMFLTGPYLDLVFTMYKKVLSDLNTMDRTCADVIKLWEVVVQNCKGRIDQYIEPSIEIALNRLNEAQKVPLKVLLIEVIANSMYYNPELLLRILENRNWTRPTFEVWFQLVPKFDRPYDKKLSILALSSLFTLPFDSLPPVVKAGSKQILVTMIKLTIDAEQQKKKLEENIKKAQEEAEIDDDESLYVEDDHELDDHEEKDEGADLITRAKEAAKYYEDENDESDNDFEDDLEDLDEENECTSPLDEIEEAIFLADRMKELATRESKNYEGMIGQLEPSVQNAYKDILQIAERKRIEVAQKKAQQPAVQQ